MKIKFLGTAAAEGIPGIFCECEVCERSRKLGGKNIRSRSQALIDDKLLIDLPPDTYYHTLKHGINLAKIENCLITHTHSDHFYPKELIMRTVGYSHLANEKLLNIYGTKFVGGVINPLNYDKTRICFEEIKDFEAFNINDYQIMPLKAEHAPDTGPVLYLITNNDKSILYAHDTGYFGDEVWDYLGAGIIHLDFVSLDCTEADRPINYKHHMNLEKNIQVRDRLIKIGCCDKETIFCLNHFSHNGGNVLYDDFVKIANKNNFMISYDGLEVIV